MKKNLRRKIFTLDVCGKKIYLGKKTNIMGIINVTPDSFSNDGCFKNKRTGTKTSITLAKKMAQQGADIIDVGGESSRPGSKRIIIKDELSRVIPTINSLAKNLNIPISIDTYKSSVAKHALDAGATIVNNIKGIKSEKNLLKMVKNYNASIVLMHIQKTPRIMQENIQYNNLIDDIYQSLQKSIENCLEIGIKSYRIIIDPGIGFGKTVENNLTIINRIAEFYRLNKPILIGTSRKSFIGKVLHDDTKNRRLGTAASVSASILRGAHIVRVHDVKEMSEIAKLTDAIMNERY